MRTEAVHAELRSRSLIRGLVLNRRVAAFAVGALSIGALVAIWHIAITASPSKIPILSSPERTLLAAKSLLATDTFWESILVTLEEIVLGLALGAASGTVVAFLAASYPRIERPLLAACITANSIPKLALAPLLIVWLGIGLTPKVVLMWFVTFVVFVLNIHAALVQLRRELLSRFRVHKASTVDVYRYLYLPHVAPAALQSLRFCIGTGTRAVIFAEFIGASAGLGYLITYYGNSLDMTNLMVVLLTIIAIGLLLEAMVALLQHRVSAWSTSTSK